MDMICEPQLKRAAVAFPCICCGSPVERENVYCPRCLQAIRARGDARYAYLEWVNREVERAA
jgi:predicted amidophosphoribosyltransferase